MATENAVPSRDVLTSAALANRENRHENLGFLSESHGFMPVEPPLGRLPDSHRDWDLVADALPEHHRDLGLRAALRRMETLEAGTPQLPDRYLARSSVILSILAHAWHRVESEPTDSLPECVGAPWETVTRRLGRPSPILSYVDLIVYNWRLVDPSRPDPMRVENLQLLIPTVDNREERVFYLTQVEILAQCTPIVAAVVRAQEAVAHDDTRALKRELYSIASRLHDVVQHSLPKIDPNPRTDSHVDPIVWAKTVAPFAVPIYEGAQGPSGTTSPIFSLLDLFFGRQRYDSVLGEEMLRLRDWYPPNWQAFLRAVAGISVFDYVENAGDGELRGAFQEALGAYIGEDGFLGRHRLKVYGYLELAFKVGRGVTIGGFSGLFRDRTWNEVDEALESSRRERTQPSLPGWHQARARALRLPAAGQGPASHVEVDVRGLGIRYQPGDRCCILPENSPELVERTLAALRAGADETVRLNHAWREAIRCRDGFGAVTSLPLSTLLRFGCIRPVERSVARSLYRLTLNDRLNRVIEERGEDQWELWDLLLMLAEGGFDPRLLLRAPPGDRDHLCRFVPPLRYRMYSISSAMAPAEGPADRLTLTVGALDYTTEATEISAAAARGGTASTFLANLGGGEQGTPVAIRPVRPPRFGLPRDPRTPVVMFAAGTGIAPFRGFLQHRAQQHDAGRMWLYLAARTRDGVLYGDEMAALVGAGRLELQVAFSREDLAPVADVDDGRLSFRPGRRRRIDELFADERTAARLLELLRDEADGGLGASFYICGRAGFARAVLDGLRAILEGAADGPRAARAEAADEALYRLVAEGRLMQEVFTTYSSPQSGRQFDASEVAIRNDDGNGYWMIVSGRVYDVTRFAQMHPGGFKIIRGYAGMDATEGYRQVLHHERPEIDSMLALYEIGSIRRLDFGREWGAIVAESGLRFLALGDMYRAWIRALYLVVEMENALDNDFTIENRATTRDEAHDGVSAYKMQFVVEVHKRFFANYVQGLCGEPAEQLWAVTAGMCDPREDSRWMRQRLDKILRSEPAGALERQLASLDTDVRHCASSPESMRRLVEICRILGQIDRRMLAETKAALRDGVRVFERHQRDTIRRGSADLLLAARRLPAAVDDFFRRVGDSLPFEPVE